jgi:hypothetical protein
MSRLLRTAVTALLAPGALVAAASTFSVVSASATSPVDTFCASVLAIGAPSRSEINSSSVVPDEISGLTALSRSVRLAGGDAPIGALRTELTNAGVALNETVDSLTRERRAGEVSSANARARVLEYVTRARSEYAVAYSDLTSAQSAVTTICASYSNALDTASGIFDNAEAISMGNNSRATIASLKESIKEAVGEVAIVTYSTAGGYLAKAELKVESGSTATNVCATFAAKTSAPPTVSVC